MARDQSISEQSVLVQIQTSTLLENATTHKNKLQNTKKVQKNTKNGALPGIEPGTSPTLRENHASRPQNPDA
ncbi:hypothetical protein AX774_g854, partial [Zancudomyces culisetae]